MIRALRDSLFGQLFLGGIVVAIILAFLFTGAGGGGSLDEECALTLGRICVEPRDFQAAYGLTMSGIDGGAAKKLQLQQKVARGLAEREVLLKEALKLGISSSEKDVDAELRAGRARVSFPAELEEQLSYSLGMCVRSPMGCEEGTMGIRGLGVERSGSFNYSAYKKQVQRSTGRSPKQFKELQMKELTAARMRSLLRSQVQVSEEEAYLSFARSRDRATARIASIRTQFFQQFLVDPSQEQQAEWKKSHADELKAAIELQKWEVGCPVVSEIRLDSIAVEAELKAAKKKLSQYRRALNAKKPIGPLARSHSAATSAQLGGLVGCVNDAYGVGHKPLLEALKDLKPGQTTEILDTIRGIHLVQLNAVVTEENQAQLIEEYLVYRLTAEALAEEKARSFAVALIEKAQAESTLLENLETMVAESLEAGLIASEAPSETHPSRPIVDISSPFGIEGNPIPSVKSMIDSEQKAPAELVFKLKANDDIHPEPVPLTIGFAVLQLKEKELTSRDDFAKDRDDIMTRLRMRKAEQVLTKRVAALIEQNGPLLMNPKYVQLTTEPKKTADADESGSVPEEE